jgi:hypothetical protein
LVNENQPVKPSAYTRRFNSAHSDAAKRALLDDLLDDHPDINKEIKLFQNRLEESKRQFTRKYKDLINERLAKLQSKLLVAEGRLQILEDKCLHDLEHSSATSLSVTFYQSKLYKHTSSRILPLWRSDLSKSFGFLKSSIIVTNIECRDRKVQRSALAFTTLRAQISNLKEDIRDNGKGRVEFSNLRTLTYRISDYEEKIRELKIIKNQISSLETSVLKGAKGRSGTKQRQAAVIGWKEAEKIARDFMRQIGFSDARLTPPGPDGGIDVVSSEAVAQVKWHVSQIGSPELQALFGIASLHNKAALFFAQKYSSEALRWGTKSKMALFKMKPSGEIEPVSSEAKRLAP